MSRAEVSETLFEQAERLEAEVAERSWTPYPDYRQVQVDWIRRVPRHWDVAPLYSRYSVELGKMLDAKRISGAHLVPYLRNSDVRWDRVNVNDLPGMDIEPREYARFILESGDLLVCEGGEVGRTAIWHGELSPCAYQKAIHRLRPLKRDRDLPRYLLYVMWAASAGGVFIAGGNPNTIPHLTGEKLRVYRFAFPPPHEQRAIAAFLDRKTRQIDQLIEKKRRLIALIQEKRAALISHAVTKGLNPDAPMKPSGIGWLGDVPRHWSMTKLRYVGRLRGGSTPSKSEAAYWNGEIPWVSPKDMKRTVIADTEDHLTDAALHDTRIDLLEPPVVLMVVRGMILLHSFPIAITAVPVAINQDMKALRPRHDLDPMYMMFLLRGLRSLMMGLIEEAGHGTRVFRTDLWKSVVVHLPPPEEQRAIVSHLSKATSRLDGLASDIDSAICRLYEYRQALTSAAVTGKIDLREEVAR